MGNSLLVPLPALSSKNHMMLSICRHCTLVLLYPGKEEINAVREAVMKYWSPGIDSEKAKFEDPYNQDGAHRFYRFNLCGVPFKHSNTTMGSISMRFMVTKIFQSFDELGWQLLVSTDLSRLNFDQTSLVFQREAPVGTRSTPSFFNISLSSTDTLRINNCSDERIKLILQICREMWIGGIQDQTRVTDRTYEIKFFGYPWNSSDVQENLSARLTLKKIIEELSKKGAQIYASCNLKNTADTLFFKDKPFADPLELVAISLNNKNRIQLLQVPDVVISALLKTIKDYWLMGIGPCRDYRPTSYQVKLGGNPWSSEGEESILARRLIVKILECMSKVGYRIFMGLDLARKQDDKVVLLFRKDEICSLRYFCLAPRNMNKLALIDAPSDILQATQRVVQNPLFRLLEENNMGMFQKFKFDWVPWQCAYNYGDGIFGRVMLLNLLVMYKRLGWRLTNSFDATALYRRNSNKTLFASDANSWYFVHEEQLEEERCSPSAPQLWNAEDPPSYEHVIETDENLPPSYDDVIRGALANQYSRV